MKKNDLVLIVVIALVCTALSYVIINSLFSQIQPNEAKVDTVEAIDSGISEPSKQVFHKDSINPAVQVFIGLEGETNSGSSEKTEASN